MPKEALTSLNVSTAYRHFAGQA